eukprot:TRINITY_DN2015_c0_g2_i2.p1 TRINITY_DN2015_c0_g2~~TRINITY_DN2015_c0_g2_i2.p1  ORF type:complete len:753 (+),score=263.92 TRINITY_DN2015_c0_g2_i2:67-2259(+)
MGKTKAKKRPQAQLFDDDDDKAPLLVDKHGKPVNDGNGSDDDGSAPPTKKAKKAANPLSAGGLFKRAPAGKKKRPEIADSDDEEEEEEENENENDSDNMNDDDDDDDDNDEMGTDEFLPEMKIERKARALDALARSEAEASKAELADAHAAGEQFVYPSPEELEHEKQVPLSREAIHSRIQEVVRVLNNFAMEREEGRKRKDYLDLLVHDLASYYGYVDWLCERLLSLFSVPEGLEFFEANESPRPLTLRANTLKTRRRDLAQALIRRGVNLDPLEKWSKVGLQVYDSQVPVGATPEYLAGHYMLQSASSFLPVMALGARENERILDMCSAPGGKSAYIAADMKNTGTLIANDVSPIRIKAVAANLHRSGARNTIVTVYDGRKFPSVMGGFDRVLVDAPCTGTGVISRDPSIKMQKRETDVRRLACLQRALLLSAIDSVDAHSATGGVVVYSTCSILPEENEEVLNYVVSRRHVRIVPTGLAFGRPAFTRLRNKRWHPSIRNAIRVYPHTHNMDGFFVAKLQKYENGVKNASNTPASAGGARGGGDDVDIELSDNEEQDEEEDLDMDKIQQFEVDTDGAPQALLKFLYQQKEKKAKSEQEENDEGDNDGDEDSDLEGDEDVAAPVVIVEDEKVKQGQSKNKNKNKNQNKNQNNTKQNKKQPDNNNNKQQQPQQQQQQAQKSKAKPVAAPSTAPTATTPAAATPVSPKPKAKAAAAGKKKTTTTATTNQRK